PPAATTTSTTIAPVATCRGAFAVPSVLWPPNHGFVTVAIQGVNLPGGGPASITITGITQDEPPNPGGPSVSEGDNHGEGDQGDEGDDNAQGDDNDQGDDDQNGGTCPAATGVGTPTPHLRAERNGQGDGRTYHIDFIAAGPGGTCSGEVTVCVPHDQGHGG